MADKLRDVMTQAPIVLDEKDTAAAAARQMKERDVGDVLVRGADGRLRGIVTDRDLVVRCLADARRDGTTSLGDLCSKEVRTLQADATIDEAVELMRERAVRRIPVTDGVEVVGIVSLGDLAQERDPKSVLGRISAAPATA